MEWVACRGRRADGKEQARRIPAGGCNEQATQQPAALLPRALQGCVDFGAGLRCSLGRDRSGYRRCASRLGQRQNLQQRDPLQDFNSLLDQFELLQFSPACFAKGAQRIDRVAIHHLVQFS